MLYFWDWYLTKFLEAPLHRCKSQYYEQFLWNCKLSFQFVEYIFEIITSSRITINHTFEYSMNFGFKRILKSFLCILWNISSECTYNGMLKITFFIRTPCIVLTCYKDTSFSCNNLKTIKSVKKDKVCYEILRN